MSSRPTTLAYSTHAPGEPIVSSRADGNLGIEIDIAPQSQRWRASWPPRSAGVWLGMICAATGALGPLITSVWWWLRSRDPKVIVMVVLAAFVEFFIVGGLIWFFSETGRRRTLIVAGPDGLTVTTVGGMAWPHPQHWSREQITDVIANPPGYESNGQIVLVLAKGGGLFQSLDGTLFLPKKEVGNLIAHIRAALGISTNPESERFE
jgi:hypothetical protein